MTEVRTEEQVVTVEVGEKGKGKNRGGIEDCRLQHVAVETITFM